MLVSTALTLASLGAKLGSGIANAVKMNDQMKSARKEMASLDDWYKAESNEDYLNTDQAQNVLRKLREMIKKNQEVTQNTAAVMGGTAEAQVAANESNNQALAEAMSGLAAQDTVRKDSLRGDYLGQKRSLQERLYQLKSAQMQSLVNAGQNAGDAIGTVAGGEAADAFGGKTLGDLFGFGKGKKKSGGTQTSISI